MGTNQWGAPFGYSQMLGLPGYVDNLQSSDVIPSAGTVTSWAGRSGVITLTPRTTAAIYTPNAQNAIPSVDGDGSSVVMSSGNFHPPANKMIIYMVAKLPPFPVVSSTLTLFEFGTLPTSSTTTLGVSWQYVFNPATFNNPNCLLQNGSLNTTGGATIRGSRFNLTTDTANNYRAICLMVNRALTWPITIGLAVAPGADMWVANSKQPSAPANAQTANITQFDNTNFNFFGGWTGAAVSQPSKLSLINAFIYAPNSSQVHTYNQIRQGLRYLSNLIGV